MRRRRKGEPEQSADDETPSQVENGTARLTRSRGCGGIGRRARFRSVWGKPRGGSSPLIRIAKTCGTVARSWPKRSARHSVSVSLKTLIAGFDGAHARLMHCLATIDTPTDEVFLPLFEALNWAVALSDLARTTKTPIPGDPGDLAGLRFARNRVHHQWANALEVGDVLWPQPLVMTNKTGGSKLAGPTVVQTWKWVPVAQLPAGHPQPQLETAYAARLEGQQAHGVLERIAASLSPLR